jgi:hypothetical protein
MINRNLKCFYLYKRHRMPICYLFSSKLILTSSILVLMYFLIMDCILFNKAKHRGPFINLDLNKDYSTNNNSSKFLSKIIQAASLTSFQSLHSNNYNNHASGSIFWPLPVKKIMMADATHYIRSPIAEFVEYAFSFSEIFPFISANFISLSHCALSVVSIKFLINDNLFWRQFGVCIFQFRNFLDSFDGVIYRAHAKKSIYRSNYGSMGYFVDAFSDVFGGLCLIGSLAIYFLKHRPLHKKLTKCFRTASTDDQSPTTHISSSNNNNNSNHEQDLFPSNLESSSLSSSTSSLILTNNNNNTNQSNNSLPLSASSSNSPSSSQSPAYYSPSVLYEKNLQFKNQLNLFFSSHISFNKYSNNKNYAAKSLKDNYTSLFATKENILLSVSLIGLRLALSALFWDRSVHTYQDLLDSQPKNELHQVNLILNYFS